MSEFIFLAAGDTYLESNSQGYFLISKSPIRTLRINKSLYLVLEKLQEGCSIAETIHQYPEIKEEKLLSILLTLTYRGYYRLERLPALKGCPSISIIIPTSHISQDLIECLESLSQLNYPQDKLEILIVADGYANSNEMDISSYKARVIRLEKPQGPATARNVGAENASGDILAFLDSDCIANKNWLKEIIPFFQVEGVGAVGGFVDGYYKNSFLDRYEEASSSLNLGPRLLFEGDTESTLYVPTCNMLVSRKAFNASDGFKNGLHVGEDVDFCWRMRNRGFYLLYIPFGKVLHKHRNQLFQMLRRRSAYGTSEANLYLSHKDKRKRLLLPVWASLSFLALILAILFKSPYPFGAILLFFAGDIIQKSINLKRKQIRFSSNYIIFSVLRTHFSFFYFTSFHLVRYYLILLLGLGVLFHPLFFFCLFAIFLTSSIDYVSKKPHLFYPIYLFFYILEHLAYQIGVFWGCYKAKFFGSYLLVFSRTYAA